MGPSLVTGAACLGAAIGIGLITAAAGRALSATSEPAAVRAVFIVNAAFIEGMGVLGVVIGVLAIELANVGDASSAVVSAVPGIGGMAAGLVLAMRGDRSAVRGLGLTFIVGLGNLGLVVGVLAVLTGRGATIDGGDAPFCAIALVFLSAAIGLGISAARSIEEAGQASSVGPSGVRQPGTLEYIRNRAITRAAIFQTMTVGASVVAMLLIVLSGPRGR